MNRLDGLGWRLHRADLRTSLHIVDDARTPDGRPILQVIETWMRESRPRAGESALGPYPPRALLALHIALANAGVQMTYSNMFNTVWFGLRSKDLRRLGLEKTVTGARAAALGDPELDRSRWNAEIERFRAAMDRMIEVMDPSPHRQMLRQTNAQLRAIEAAVTDEQRRLLDQRRRRLLLVCNALIDASVRHCDGVLQRDLGWQWRDDWWGDILIDGHMVAVAKAGRGSGTSASQPDGFHGYDPDADYWHHDRQLGEVWAHQLVIAMSAHRTFQSQVPVLGLSMSIGKPSSGDLGLARDAVIAAREAGYTPPKRRRARLIADMGFTEKIGYAEQIHDLGYDRVIEYPARVITDHDLGNGLVLLAGIPVCAQLAKRIRQLLRHLPDTHGKLTDDEFLAQEQLERHVRAARAHLHKRWRRSTNGVRTTAGGYTTPGGAPGRPSDLPKPAIWLSQAGGCGADWLEARCPRKPRSMKQAPKDAPTVDVPLLEYVAGRPDTTALPEMCWRQYSAIRLTEKQFKQAQEVMAGTWKHRDIYAAARSANERYHSNLKSRAGGALGKDTRHVTGTARVALVCAATIVVTNQRQTKAFRRRVIRGGQLPKCTRLRERDSRLRRSIRLATRNQYLT